MAGFWYTVACVIVPCVIGAVMYVAFEVWDRIRLRARGKESLPVIDFLI